ncbi:hypothetical protein BGX38DRAFT_471438 [Terfezia claveryi]|nr:hypothetical protein BGX38DRAFT_471438 [Terfezia claveryi]
MTTNAGQYAPGISSISNYMDAENIFEQYFNDGAETESKGPISAQTTPLSDPPSENSIKSSPPLTTRSAAASPQVSSMPYFDESQMEGLWDHFALEDGGGYRENTTQGGNGYMYSTAGGVSVPAIPSLPSVPMAAIQPNQVTHQPPHFLKPTVNPPLQTLVHGYPSNTQAVHGQVTPVEDNQQTGIPVFPPDIFNNGSFTGGMDSPPQSRRGSISPQQQQSSRRSRKNSKACRDMDEHAQEEKRRRFLERNRVAASKCRQKKKEWMHNLEETARTAQNNSKYLQAAVIQLKDELLLLKQELLKHHDQQKRGSEASTPVKPRQLSIAESEMSEMSDMNVLGEELDIFADETMNEIAESENSTVYTKWGSFFAPLFFFPVVVERPEV